jgi:hypothetical protein
MTILHCTPAYATYIFIYMYVNNAPHTVPLQVLEYNLVVSLFTTTMVRNFVYIFYAAHWAGASTFQLATGVSEVLEQTCRAPSSYAGLRLVVQVTERIVTCRMWLLFHRFPGASYRGHLVGHVSRPAGCVAFQIRQVGRCQSS